MAAVTDLHTRALRKSSSFLFLSTLGRASLASKQGGPRPGRPLGKQATAAFLPCFSGPDGGRQPPSSMGLRVPDPVTLRPELGIRPLSQLPNARAQTHTIWKVSSRGPERRVLGGPPALGRHTPTGEPARATGLPSGPCHCRRGGCRLSLTAAAKQPHHHDKREKPCDSKTPALPKDDGP